MLPHLLLIFILAGLNAGAARSLASVPWCYRIYVLTTLTPLLARFATLGEPGDRVNQRVVELLLEKLGLSCLIISDGTTALEVATLETWDAMLMDCQMPGMDGFEATRQIRRKLADKPLPIIALTANAMTGDREACEAAGMNDFLAKPVRQEELSVCLEKWLTSPGAV